MSKKKNKKKHSHAPRTPRPGVRLSQVMIVKNEERNIKRALSWAKDIAFEQIVVDTGSTDRTVEIAKQMGAKIFHFEWINDFSAAKNFAIDQAQGDWIAFLDADEYFSTKDTKKIMPFLKYVMEDRALREKWLVIQCPWAQIDETGKVFSMFTQERLFRNLPGLRYEGRIHEKLNVHVDNTVHGDDITIMHTGYSDESHSETNKIERNIKMLEVEVKENPDNATYKGYLAEALKAKAEKAGNYSESSDKIEALFYEAIDEKHDVLPLVRKNAYMNLLQTFSENPEKFDECKKLCENALEIYPNDLDFEYYYAVALHGKGEYEEAWEALERCKARLTGGEAVIDSQIITTNPGLLLNQIKLTAEKLGNT